MGEFSAVVEVLVEMRHNEDRPNSVAPISPNIRSTNIQSQDCKSEESKRNLDKSGWSSLGFVRLTWYSGSSWYTGRLLVVLVAKFVGDVQSDVAFVMKDCSSLEIVEGGFKITREEASATL
jgi:hypothetical protein